MVLFICLLLLFVGGVGVFCLFVGVMFFVVVILCVFFVVDFCVCVCGGGGGGGGVKNKT